MYKTGNLFIDSFSQAIVFVPLLPVIIIFLRSIYQKDVLTFLLVLCLINVTGNLLTRITRVNNLSLIWVLNLFSLLELLILAQICKSALRNRYRDFVDIFLVAFVSAMLTYDLVKGSAQGGLLSAYLQGIVIIVVTALSLGTLMKNNHLYIFHSPLFWIAVGTLFYFVITLLLELAGSFFVQIGQTTTTDKMILLNIASLMRYFFYALAALFYHSSRTPDSTSLF